MKYFQSILLIVFIQSAIYSQQITPIFSDVAEVPKHEFLFKHIKKSEDKMVFITESFDKGIRKNFVCTYEKNKKLKREMLVASLKNAYGYDFFTLDNKMYRWYMSKHEKSKSILRSVVRFNDEGKATDVKSMPKIPYKDYAEQPTQSIYYSPDSSKVLAVEVVDENHKKNPVRISLSVLSEGLEATHERVFTGKEKSQRSTDHCIARITNTGEAYLLQKVIPEGKLQKMVNNRVIPNYYYELIKVLSDGSTKAYRIDSLQSFSNIQNMYLTSEGYPMVVTSINESSSESSPLIGLFLHVYNDETDRFDSKKITFKNKLRKWGITKDMDYKQLFNFFDLSADYVISEDRIHILLERSYFDMKGKGRKGAYAVNVKKTALVLSISNEGKVVDDFYLPKVYDSEKPAQGSKLIVVNDKVYLLYLLNEKYKNADFADLILYESDVDNFGATSSIFCLATKEEEGIKKWDVRNSQALGLSPNHVKYTNEKIFVPFVDYTTSNAASLGVMTLKVPVKE